MVAPPTAATCEECSYRTIKDGKITSETYHKCSDLEEKANGAGLKVETSCFTLCALPASEPEEPT